MKFILIKFCNVEEISISKSFFLIAFSCKCPEGFEGPQCQMTTRSFDGRGWAWFPSLQQCENSHLSLEFMTRKPDGLLLYNGPISNPDIGEIAVQDFISLELQSGRPRLLIDFGSGTAEVIVYVDETLSDGEWHQVDIFWDREVRYSLQMLYC